MASEAKQETNRSDPDVVRLGPKFAPGTWFWQEAPEPARKGARAKPPRWVQYEQDQANRLEWCHQAGVQRVVVRGVSARARPTRSYPIVVRRLQVAADVKEFDVGDE